MFNTLRKSGNKGILINLFEIRYVVYLYSFYLYFDVKYTHKLRRPEKKTKLLSIITEFYY